MLKNSFKKALSVCGYQLNKTTNLSVSYSNFENLTRAYEQNLNQVNKNSILPNENRAKLLARLMGTPPSEAYFIVQALTDTKNIAGDVCEFGVAQGETSALIANEILSNSEKFFHLFDSFQGLPKPTEQDRLKDDIYSLGSMKAYTGTMSCPEDMLKERLKAVSFPSNRYVIHKGFIEKVFPVDKNLPKAVSFAYIDFDFYEPIKLTLEYLDNVTYPGAVIVVDDYDFFSTGAKTAVDEWLEKKNLNGIVYECFIPDKVYGHFAILTKK